MSMKWKVYAIILVAVAIAGYNGYLSHKSTTKIDLLLANVEALAGNFEWDGTDWTSDEQWYNDTPFTSDWTPSLADCTVTYGVNGVLVYEVTVHGKKVVCSAGSGNCVNGSTCTAG